MKNYASSNAGAMTAGARAMPSRWRSVFRAASVAACAFSLGACATSGPVVQNPQVVLTNVALTDISFRSQKFRLSFDVQNPNAFPLPVRSIRYKVLLDQQQFAGGETDSNFTVPANGESSFNISVELDLINSASRIAGLLQRGHARPLPYELHGSLRVNIPFTRPLSFNQRGTIVVQ